MNNKNLRNRMRVSIHAPARGATLKDDDKIKQEGVSIHAPARGATLVKHNLRRRGKFQSTPPRGGRRKICLTIQ